MKTVVKTKLAAAKEEGNSDFNSDDPKDEKPASPAPTGMMIVGNSSSLSSPCMVDAEVDARH